MVVIVAAAPLAEDDTKRSRRLQDLATYSAGATTTRWDHACLVTNSLTGEKYSKEQACRDHDNYLNISGRNRDFTLKNLQWLKTTAEEDDYPCSLLHMRIGDFKQMGSRPSAI